MGSATRARSVAAVAAGSACRAPYAGPPASAALAAIRVTTGTIRAVRCMQYLRDREVGLPDGSGEGIGISRKLRRWIWKDADISNSGPVAVNAAVFAMKFIQCGHLSDRYDWCAGRRGTAA